MHSKPIYLMKLFLSFLGFLPRLGDLKCSELGRHFLLTNNPVNAAATLSD